ncbi:MAG: CCA tRNA nucleotidyltransferase [Candidatus Omnitrophica bacterium]|nr:CCA tRNA nucleotidyltransferase [Candidatus Omnitrophota bacterium]
MNLNSKAAQAAYRVAEKLKSKQHHVVFAGGCVRDFLMKKTPQDFDLATSATPDEVESIFPKTVAVGKQFGVILVIDHDEQIEVTTFRRDGGYCDGRHPSEISFTDDKEDALRRDFTVNGLFYDPFSQQVLDYVGGETDLQKKVIRAIGDPAKRFEEDKLRLLRAVRFAANLDFSIEANTWREVVRLAPQIHQVSPERIRDELVKIFTRPGAARGFDLLSESGLMREILPEVEAMRGVQQQPDFHPEGDVFVHTRLLMEKLDQPSVTLAFAALFHDIAKPVTAGKREDGRITFYEHAPIGAEMTRGIMKRLRFSNQMIDDTAILVANHMKFGDAMKMRSGKLKMFIAHEQFQEGLELHRIDCMSCHGMLENYHFLQEKQKALTEEELKPKPFLSGHDLLALGMAAGPAMKPFLEEVYILQLEGQFKDKAEALDWARIRLKHS